MEEKKIKIEIKNRKVGKVLFEYENVNNTLKDTIKEAIKSGANLRVADLSGANLSGADLSGANLSGAKNIPYIPLACPSDGAFIGWKKVVDQEDDRQYLVKLLIPEDAKRSSSTGIKCRCDKAKVLAIYDLADNMAEKKIVIGTNYVQTCYMVGEEVLPDSFDENRWNDCSHGIHFFINKQDAINY